MSANTTGGRNSAVGAGALNAITTGFGNNAFGYAALLNTTTPNGNNAFGAGTLAANQTGQFNDAFGAIALEDNTTGSYNAAFGTEALGSNTTASFNTALAPFSLWVNTTGTRNTGVGYFSLGRNTTGSDNIALGYAAGQRLTTGSNNIDIGNGGVAGESRTIRIGTRGVQTKTFVAGVRGVTVTGGVAVLVNSLGQLGVQSSSARFKEDISPMTPALSERLLQLRPVTFRYKQADESGAKPLQYGLIAEEVAKVYPELVAYDSQGRPEAVAYQTLSSLLLNEYQRQHRQLVDAMQEAKAASASVVAMRQQAGGRDAEIASLRQALANDRAGHEREMTAMRTELTELRQATRQLVAAQEAAQMVAGN
jgi:hypothetical protein